VFVARNAVFLEKEFLSKEVSGSTVRLEEVQETLENVLVSTNEEMQQDEPAMVADNMLNPNLEDQYGHIAHLKSTRY
jgi:hypothetical protein